MTRDCTMVHSLTAARNNSFSYFFLRYATRGFRGTPLHDIEYELQKLSFIRVADIFSSMKPSSTGMNVIDRVSFSALEGSERVKKIRQIQGKNEILRFCIVGFGRRVTHSLNHMIPSIVNLDLRNGSPDLSGLQFRWTLSNITHHSQMV
jgi:hypothetical protein